MVGLYLFSKSADICDKSHGFFSLIPWYHYLPPDRFNDPDRNCGISKFNLFPSNDQPSDFGYVMLAVIDDLLRIAALVAIGFVIYGAIRYITSEGNSEGATQARDTITNALVGLVVALVAITFVSFLGNRLG
jgi:hypothetical protein